MEENECVRERERDDWWKRICVREREIGGREYV